MSSSFNTFSFLALVLLIGCDRNEQLSDSELLRSIDFDNPRVEDVPALVSLFDEHSYEVCQRAIEALGQIGDPAVPGVLNKLRSNERLLVRYRARLALRRIGSSAIPALIDALDEDGYDHRTILYVLGDIRPTTDAAVSALIGALDGDSMTVRTALDALRRLEFLSPPELQTAVPAIVPLLGHENSRIRIEAAHSLTTIDFRTADQLGVFRPWLSKTPLKPAPYLSKLRDDSELVRSIDFDDPQPQDVPALIQLFEDHSHQVFRRASDALIAIGPSVAAPLVESLRRDRPVLVRVRAADVLWRLGPPAISPISTALPDERYERVRLIYVLGRIRPVTPEAVTSLLFIVEERGFRLEALDALAWMGSEAKEAVPALLLLLDERDRLVRSQAARALWNIDQGAAQDAGLEGPRPPPRDL